LRDRTAAVEAEEPRFTRMRKLTQVSRALTHATSVDEVLSLTVTRAVDLLGAEQAVVLLQDGGGRLDVRATHAISPEALRDANADPAATLEARLAALLGDAFAQRSIAVPLVVSGKVSGALAVAGDSKHLSEEEAEWLLSALADQTMVALEKERLDELQGRAREQALIARVGELLLARHDVRAVLPEVLAAARETLDVDLACVFERLHDGSFSRLASAGLRGEVRAPAVLRGAQASWESAALDHERPMTFDADPEDRLGRGAFLGPNLGVTSGLLVGIDHPRGFGVVGLYTRARRSFSQPQRDLLASLGALLGSALEREAAEAQLRSASEMREDLLAIVSHDLRNPLTAIVAAASLLSNNDVRGSADRMARYGDIIGRNARRMSSMISDLLDFERVRGGGLQIQQAEHDVSLLLDEAVEMMQPQAKERSQRITNRSPSLTLVWCDRERLLQVLSNLLGNAVKFTPQGGSITVGADVVPGEVRVFVRDTGPGIPEADRPHVFDRYWQAKRSDRRGIGLGLPIARGIVEAHGGKIWVESEKGRGTTFFFTIPSIDAHAAPGYGGRAGAPEEPHSHGS
jgi:signal transduction histidine kinase